MSSISRYTPSFIRSLLKTFASFFPLIFSSLTTSFISQYILNSIRRFSKPLEISEPPQNSRLLELPTEVLLLIAKELDWKDVVELRKVCKTLNRASRTLEIWKLLFSYHLKTSVPKPHLFIRDVDQFSVEQYEATLRAYHRPEWDSAFFSSKKTMEPPPCPTTGKKAHMANMYIPGGPWSLHTRRDGSVWCLNFGSSSWTPFIPSAVEGTTSDLSQVDTFMAIDVWSDGTTRDVEPGSPNLPAQFKAFNLAVITRRTAGTDPDGWDAIIQIWRVEIRAGDNGSSPTLAVPQLLASFHEDPLVKFDACSLFGNAVSYSTYCEQTQRWMVVVVEWNLATIADGLAYERWYIPDTEGEMLYLLPDDRLFVGFRFWYLGLWHWRRNSSTTRPSEIGRNEFPPLTSLWEHKMKQRVSLQAHPHFWKFHNSVRLILLTKEEVIGVIIPPGYTQSETPQPVDMVPLLKGQFGHLLSSNAPGFGYHRAAFYTEGGSDFVTTRYSWPDDIIEDGTPDYPASVCSTGIFDRLGLNFAFDLYIDETASRVAFVDRLCNTHISDHVAY